MCFLRGFGVCLCVSVFDCCALLGLDCLVLRDFCIWLYKFCLVWFCLIGVYVSYEHIDSFWFFFEAVVGRLFECSVCCVCCFYLLGIDTSRRLLGCYFGLCWTLWLGFLFLCVTRVCFEVCLACVFWYFMCVGCNALILFLILLCWLLFYVLFVML